MPHRSLEGHLRGQEGVFGGEEKTSFEESSFAVGEKSREPRQLGRMGQSGSAMRTSPREAATYYSVSAGL